MLGTRGSAMLRAMSTHAPSLEALSVPSAGGEARWWFDGLAVIKATALDTGGQMTILEVSEPPNSKAPLHVHHHEDEGFWILDGGATFYVGDRTITARPGDYVFGPRHVPHRFTTGPDGCHMLFIFTPGGFEELLRAISRPAESNTLPPASGDPPSDDEIRQMQAALQAHGCELLG
jgi:quercetin dioxygenase-like cupin family protein